VVQTFAVVAVSSSSGNDDWNNNPRRADILRNADVKFPTEEGLLGYQMRGPLAPARVRILASDANQVAHDFQEFVRVSNEFQGVSAFDSFTVDLGDFATDRSFPPGNASAVVVYFDALTRTSSGPLNGVGVCAASGAGSSPGDGSGGPGDGGGGPGDGSGGPGGGPDGSPPGGGPAGGSSLSSASTPTTAAAAHASRGGRR